MPLFRTYPSLQAPALQMTNIVVNVKYNASSPFTVNVHSDWRIWEVKKEISQNLKLAPEEIQLIFTGCVLKNEAFLKVF